jgi:hypothetical protein
MTTEPAIKKAPIIMRNTMPGLPDKNTENGFSPFMYSASVRTAIENSERQSETRRSKSLFWRKNPRTMLNDEIPR